MILLLAAALLMLAGGPAAAEAAVKGDVSRDTIRRIVPGKVKKLKNTSDFPSEYPEETEEEEEYRPEIYKDYRKQMEKYKEYIGDMIYFNQKDEVWNLNGYCVDRSGCGPTSMAVVISSLKDEWVTPLDTVEWASSHGYYSGDGSVHEMIPALAKAYGLTCEGLGTSFRKIRSALRKGHPVVCLMGEGYFTAGGHFMVLTGINSKDCVTVADVGSRERSSYKYRLKDIISQSKTAGAGGPFWSLGYERMSGLAEGKTLRDYMEEDPDDAFGSSFLADAEEGLSELTAVALSADQMPRRLVLVTEPVSGGLFRAHMAGGESGQAFSALMTRKSRIPVNDILSGSVSGDDSLTSDISVERHE